MRLHWLNLFYELTFRRFQHKKIHIDGVSEFRKKSIFFRDSGAISAMFE